MGACGCQGAWRVCRFTCLRVLCCCVPYAGRWGVRVCVCVCVCVYVCFIIGVCDCTNVYLLEPMGGFRAQVVRMFCYIVFTLCFGVCVCVCVFLCVLVGEYISVSMFGYASLCVTAHVCV